MKRIIALLITIVCILNMSVAVLAEDETSETEPTVGNFGWALMSEEETQAFNASLPYIIDVKPNQVALSRIENIDLFSGNEHQVSIGDEIVCSYPDEVTPLSINETEFELADSVDVSESYTFPVIGHQGDYSSCVDWSLVYYQMTNNTCLIKGRNARNSANVNNPDNVFNPYWVYALTNGGENFKTGTFYNEACAAVMSYGVPTYSEYSSESISEWSTNTNDWMEAMYNKPLQISYANMDSTDIKTTDSPDIVKLKKILSNGYIVTISADYNSFVWTTITSNGQYACKYAETPDIHNWHALTIVGYDDNMWVDINGNRSEDSGEYGAFKIANSWGKNARNSNNGFFWLAYDAIGKLSGVSNATSENRIRAFTDYYLLQPRKSYEPLYVAKINLDSNNRNQIGITIGISDENENTPDTELNITRQYKLAFNYANRSQLILYNNIIPNRRFKGTTSDITLPVDITPVIEKLYSETGMPYNQPIKIYVTVSDNTDDNEPVYYKHFKLYEANVLKGTSDTEIRTIDNGSRTKSVVFTPETFVASYNNPEITMNFNSNIYPESVNEQSIFITDSEDTSSDFTKLNSIYTVSDSKVTLELESDAYIPECVYWLNINNNLKSMGRNNLSESLCIPVYILNKFYDYEWIELEE